MSVSLAELFESPDYLPSNIDSSRRILFFSKISSAEYRRLPFLDSRTTSTQNFAVNIDDLLLYRANAQSLPRPSRFILHTAYCCSTLLARYIESLRGCLVLKEPSILSQFAAQLGTQTYLHSPY